MRGFIKRFNREYTNEELLLSTESNNLTTSDETSTQAFDNDDDDVVELNVGGERITTLRSTLTAVPNSKLAIMFAKNNTNMHQLKDKLDAVFFDYNPIQFKYLLDQLRSIKRTPTILPYEMHFDAPIDNIRTNFSDMIFDFGLNPEQFLSPLTGVHLNLQVKSLIGWEECYRSTYDIPFDVMSAVVKCNGPRLLITCSPVNNTEMLTLAGIGTWKNISICYSRSTECSFDIKNGIGFYLHDQAIGFEGRPLDFASTSNSFYISQNSVHTSVHLNPCDANDANSDYRLCWSLRSATHRGGGDRCGKTKNLHNSFDWQRTIYRAI